MTDNTSIVNRALQSFGSRTTVTAAELANSSSNEAIQANLCLTQVRDELIRMAPWDCANFTRALAYITSLPGTPENTSPATSTWQIGQPPPPWLYEYQYPLNCLRACYVIPQMDILGINPPITTAVTGSYPSAASWAPVKFKVVAEGFFTVVAATPVAGGSGYAFNDAIVLATGVAGVAPIGAPAVLVVGSVDGAGAVLTATVFPQIPGSSPPQGGSYISRPVNPVGQSATSGSGAGATFNLTLTSGQQRVILTNAQNALLNYNIQLTDPNVMDPLFQDAWVSILGARLVMALTGDKTLANLRIQACNAAIEEARKADGNEGLTINDVTPDWIRGRGINFDSDYPTIGGYDWGPMFPYY